MSCFPIYDVYERKFGVSWVHWTSVHTTSSLIYHTEGIGNFWQSFVLPKKFLWLRSLIISPMVLVVPPLSPWVITGSCFQISPLWAPPCSLPSSGAPTRSPSRATETPRQPREDDCRCPARRCWSTSSTAPPPSPWWAPPGTDDCTPPLPRAGSTRPGPTPGGRGTSATAGLIVRPSRPGQTTTGGGERVGLSKTLLTVQLDLWTFAGAGAT